MAHTIKKTIAAGAFSLLVGGLSCFIFSGMLPCAALSHMFFRSCRHRPIMDW